MRRPQPHLEPRLRRLLDTAWRAGGDLDAVAALLGISLRALGQQLSVLRGSGVARWATLHDPRSAGRGVEALVLVRLGDYGAAAMAEFEAALRDDPQVTDAALVAGWFDYQIRVAFPDADAKGRWLHHVRGSPQVAEVLDRPLRVRWGHQLDGLPVWRRGADSGATGIPRG